MKAEMQPLAETMGAINKAKQEQKHESRAIRRNKYPEDRNMDRCSMCMCMALVLISTVSVIGLAEAQIVSSCVAEIPACWDYINSTTPPNFCCDPIKHLFATQHTCLCKFVFSPGLEAFGLTSTQAINFGRSCGVDLNITLCKAALSAPSPSSSANPPATRGSDEGGAGRVAFSGLSFVLLFWTSILFN